jgi:Kip1 ubiquitination-promoting complex protein 1
MSQHATQQRLARHNSVARPQVEFALNGQSLGVAFSELRTFEPQLAYFPAVSLSEGECAYVNLGARPLRYPLDGFKPLQTPPPPHRAEQCAWLLEKLGALCMVRAARMPAMRACAPGRPCNSAS